MKKNVLLSLTVLLAACGAGSLPTSRTDTTPPTAKAAIEPPEATAADPFVLAVTAEDDLAGVAKVVARVKGAKAATATMFEGTLLAADAKTPTGVPLKGTWNLPIHFEPGANHVEVWAVDMAGNSGEGGGQDHDFSFEIVAGATPPTVTCAATPEWVSSASIDLAITATDTGSGVGGVFCRAANSAVSIAATASEAIPGLWICTAPLQTGANAIKVWATDGSRRSGESMAPPYSLTRMVNLAPDAPAIAVGYFASYRPEGSAVLTSGATPPAIDYHTDLVSVGAGSTVQKMVETLSWGSSAPSADTLESTSTNTPFLVFEVTTQAPLASARYHIDIAGTHGSVQAPSDGVLLKSSRSGGNKSIYLLPLATETLFPAYGSGDTSWSGAAPYSLTATATVTDAAGQAASLAVPLRMELVGAPLWIVEDTTYPAARDPLSTHAYQLVDGSLDGLRYGPSNTALGTDSDGTKVMRLVRFTVANPYNLPVPLSIALAPNPSWSFSTAKSRFLRPIPMTPTGDVSINGVNLPITPTWTFIDEAASQGSCSGSKRGYQPCNGNGTLDDCWESRPTCPDRLDWNGKAWYVPMHIEQGGPMNSACVLEANVPLETTEAPITVSKSEDLRLLAYQTPPNGGGETLVGSSGLAVPAHGALAVYLVRTVRENLDTTVYIGRIDNRPWRADAAYGAWDPSENGRFYGIGMGVYWTVSSFDPLCITRHFYATYQAKRSFWRLMSAQDVIGAHVTFATGGGTVGTNPNMQYNNADISRSIVH